jgi:Uma2 family endonuclease
VFETVESGMVIRAQTYEQVALEDPDGQWELDCGRLRQKPGMTYEHNGAAGALLVELAVQLERGEFQVYMNAPRLRIPSGSFYIPDITVVPRALFRQRRQRRRGRLEVYEEPMPLVVEVWSPSTGDYDVQTKLQQYQQRGDAEIWLVHPYDRTLTAWRRQPNGGYSETLYREGSIEPMALPGVRIELAALFV